MNPRDERRPTPKQISALARELCTKTGTEYPRTFAQASALIERLRGENGKA